ncbi:unnamed protein product [Urochloa decumbens]|uniref:DUF4005 domain-containing protein n=1 Tax=Urochloa decumbens TaxID=240449 RepID=A0ABC8Y6Y4_9POAL
MGKAGRWLKSFLSGKKDRPRAEAAAAAAPPASGAPPKDKRWSFRRPAAQEGKSAEGLGLSAADIEFDQKKHAVAVAVATAAAADAAVAAAHAAAVVARLSSRRSANLPASLAEDAAAVRIQATFRGYLARTALCALRGIVKLQALVRGQLVRKQANATLRCMQALLTAQSHLRAQRMRVLHQDQHHHPLPPTRPRQSPQHPRHRRSYEMDRSCEENAKIVEMDIGETARRGAAKDRQLILHAEHHYGRCCSPAPSAAATELMSPRAYSGHFDELSLTARSSPQQQGSEACPSYMANTESSRAKARSQSAPRQRTDALERQPSRRKGTPPRCITARMQRSSSLAGAAPRGGGGGQASPWSAGLRLDASSASLKDSECGSTTSVLTAATVYSRTRSLVGFEVRRGLY